MNLIQYRIFHQEAAQQNQFYETNIETPRYTISAICLDMYLECRKYQEMQKTKYDTRHISTSPNLKATKSKSKICFWKPFICMK